MKGTTYQLTFENFINPFGFTFNFSCTMSNQGHSWEFQLMGSTLFLRNTNFNLFMSNQLFSFLFILNLAEIDGFENPPLEIDKFGRPPPTHTNTAPAT